MPTAETALTTSRRAALYLVVASSAAAALPFDMSGTASASTVPAMESGLSLLAACDEYIRLETARNRLFDEEADEAKRAPVHEAIDAEQEPLIELIVTRRANSYEEHRARARCLATMADGMALDADFHTGCLDSRMIAALVRDLSAAAEG